MAAPKKDKTDSSAEIKALQAVRSASEKTKSGVSRRILKIEICRDASMIP